MPLINVNGTVREMTAEEIAAYAPSAAVLLADARTRASSRIDAGYSAATSATHTFTSGGTTYTMPLSDEFQQLASLAMLDATASGSTVYVPHLAGVLPLGNAEGKTVLAGYSSAARPHVQSRFTKRLAIAAASTVDAADAIVW